MFKAIEELVGSLIGLIISIILGIWFFINLDPFFSWLKSFFNKKVICPKCRKRNSVKANFCTKCGNNLKEKKA
jgi:ribosomal protein L40E